MILQLVAPWGNDTAAIEDTMWVFDGTQYTVPRVGSLAVLFINGAYIGARITGIDSGGLETDPRLLVMNSLTCECFCGGTKINVDVTNEEQT